jgi:hypothetical protein
VAGVARKVVPGVPVAGFTAETSKGRFTFGPGVLYLGDPAEQRRERAARRKREASLQRYFVGCIRREGWLVYRNPPAGRNGKPDWTVLARLGQTVLVELKKEGEPLEPHQEREHRRLRKLGHHVRVIDSNAGVDSLITALRHGFFTTYA